MAVNGNLGCRKHQLLHPADFTRYIRCAASVGALMDRHTALQVWQRERGLPVTAVYRTDQIEQSRILADGHQLPVAGGPIYWGEIKPEAAHFTEKWIRHDAPACELLLRIQVSAKPRNFGGRLYVSVFLYALVCALTRRRPSVRMTGTAGRHEYFEQARVPRYSRCRLVHNTGHEPSASVAADSW